ncbi:MAG: hypothetical protein CMF50_06065 [Legionellales bacterium]|nr:hypothetical protein [Legionellales bacterium]
MTDYYIPVVTVTYKGKTYVMMKEQNLDPTTESKHTLANIPFNSIDACTRGVHTATVSGEDYYIFDPCVGHISKPEELMVHKEGDDTFHYVGYHLSNSDMFAADALLEVKVYDKKSRKPYFVLCDDENTHLLDNSAAQAAAIAIARKQRYIEIAAIEGAPKPSADDMIAAIKDRTSTDPRLRYVAKGYEGNDQPVVEVKDSRGEVQGRLNVYADDGVLRLPIGGSSIKSAKDNTLMQAACDLIGNLNLGSIVAVKGRNMSDAKMFAMGQQLVAAGRVPVFYDKSASGDLSPKSKEFYIKFLEELHNNGQLEQFRNNFMNAIEKNPGHFKDRQPLWLAYRELTKDSATNLEIKNALDFEKRGLEVKPGLRGPHR